MGVWGKKKVFATRLILRPLRPVGSEGAGPLPRLRRQGRGPLDGEPLLQETPPRSLLRGPRPPLPARRVAEGVWVTLVVQGPVREGEEAQVAEETVQEVVGEDGRTLRGLALRRPSTSAPRSRGETGGPPEGNQGLGGRLPPRGDSADEEKEGAVGGRDDQTQGDSHHESDPEAGRGDRPSTLLRVYPVL